MVVVHYCKDGWMIYDTQYMMFQHPGRQRRDRESNN